MDQLSKESLPSTMGADWTEITLQQVLASDFARTLSEAHYRRPWPSRWRWSLCSWCWRRNMKAGLSPVDHSDRSHVPAGVNRRDLAHKMDNNIFTQIGLVVLIGLAAKNAILIVEFAKQNQDQGANRIEATIQACRLRLRPILMTSFAFILGVVPLVLAKGAGRDRLRWASRCSAECSA